MAHPQSTPRGNWATKRLDIGASNLTANSTGIILSAGLMISNQSAHKITANSTGILIGSLYISCNSTGNTTT